MMVAPRFAQSSWPGEVPAISRSTWSLRVAGTLPGHDGGSGDGHDDWDGRSVRR